MSLDLFSQNIDDAVAYASRASAPELPTTFSENFSEAWSRGLLTSQSIAETNRKGRVVSDYADELYARTKDAALLRASAGGAAALNFRIRQLKAADPTLDIAEISPDEIQAKADELGRRQLEESADFARRERTVGGAVGQFAGSAAADIVDPVNVLAFPLAAPESLGVIGTALAWSAIGGGSQAVIEALNAPGMERIQPGYLQSGQAFGNILESAAFAGALGGGLKSLSAAWTRAKTGSWPRTIRDAGNVVESEAQIAATNPLAGPGGEAAHRTALQKAIDDVAAGRPVDVEGVVPAELLRDYDARLRPTMDAINDITAARNAVQMERAALSGQTQPELPFAGSIAEAQEAAAIGKAGARLEEISRAAGAPLDPADARALADRLSRMPAEDIPATLDELLLRPTTLRETIPAAPVQAREPRDIVKPDAAAALREQTIPTKIEEMRTDPELPDTVSRDLDKLMLERPDIEVPTGVTVDAEGRPAPTMQKVEDVIAEADRRLSAADEIMACVGPYPSEAAQ